MSLGLDETLWREFYKVLKAQDIRGTSDDTAVANAEPHQPHTKDMLISYEHWDNGESIKGFLSASDWPDLLVSARGLAAFNSSRTQFALLRLWSAPHF